MKREKRKSEMIDLHCHIIPKIDDGPKELSITIEMIKAAKEQGFDGAFAVSHFIEGELENNSDIIFKGISDINAELIKQNIAFDIYSGNEIFISNNIVELLDQKKACTLNNSRYVLIELPLNEKVLYLEKVIFDLVSEGYIPIIAHPERYEWVQNNPNELIDIINMGALIQVNAGSIAGLYGRKIRKTSKILLKHNMVNFIASDSHSVNRIYSKFSSILNKIIKITGEENLDLFMRENPKKVVSNSIIDIEEPIRYKRRIW